MNFFPIDKSHCLSLFQSRRSLVLVPVYCVVLNGSFQDHTVAPPFPAHLLKAKDDVAAILSLLVLTSCHPVLGSYRLLCVWFKLLNFIDGYLLYPMKGPVLFS